MRPTTEMLLAVAANMRRLLNSGTPDGAVAWLLWAQVAGHIEMLRSGLAAEGTKGDGS